MFTLYLLNAKASEIIVRCNRELGSCFRNYFLKTFFFHKKFKKWPFFFRRRKKVQGKKMFDFFKEKSKCTCILKDSDFGFMPRSKYQKIRFFSSLLFTFLSKPWILRQCLPCIFWMPRPQKLSLGAIVSWDEALEIIFLKTFFPTKSSKNGHFFFLTRRKILTSKNSRTTHRKFFYIFFQGERDTYMRFQRFRLLVNATEQVSKNEVF